MPRPLQARRQDCRDRPGRGAGEHRIPPSVRGSSVAGLPRRLRHAGAGHRHRPQRTRLRRRGLHLLPPLRHEGRRHPESGPGGRQVRRRAPVLRRHGHLGRQPADRREAGRSRRIAALGEIHAQLHALLAPQDTDHLSRDDPVVRRHGRCSRLSRREACRDAARHCAARHRRDAVLPGVGQGAAFRDDRQPPRLDAVAPAALGDAAAVLRRPQDRRAASGHAGAARARREEGRGRRHRDLVRGERRGLRRRRDALAQAHRHSRRVVRLRDHAPDGDGRSAGTRAAPAGRGPKTPGSRPTSTSKARTSTAAGSIRRC